MRMLKPCLAVLICVCALPGCATYHQVLVNPTGQTTVCGSYGAGLIGVGMADSIFDECMRSMKAAGFIEIENAGVIGITLADSLAIARVEPKGPADLAGVSVGDKILSINGIGVHAPGEALVMLFGAPGSSVTVSLDRDGTVTVYELVRKRRTEVFGTPPQASTSEAVSR